MGCRREFGGLSDEMVGLRIEQHQIGLNRLLRAPLIGCRSYDLRSYMHIVFDFEHECRAFIYSKPPIDIQ